jgi:FkbH-like protein
VARLAEDLGLGLDAMVFWDDNPLERAEMRFRCPEVLTPEPPQEVEAWPDALAAIAVFDRFATTAEDRQKAEHYAARARFQALRQDCGEIDFLKQLQLRPREVALGAATLDRALQLVTKTNQFNLRGVRHDAAALAALAQDPRGVTFLVHLRDQFGDHGLVALVLCRETLDAETAFLEGLMISCRVLGRHLEAWALARACELLRAKGFQRLLAEYRPLARNGMTRDVLPSLGLHPLLVGHEAAAAAAQAGLSAGDGGLLFTADLEKLSLPYQDLFIHDGSNAA